MAALLTPKWVARHLEVPKTSTGSSSQVTAPAISARSSRKRGIAVERGPVDLRDLPRHFGQAGGPTPVTEPIRSRSWLRSIMPRDSRSMQLIEEARRLRSEGADVIDLGCVPGTRWTDVGHAIDRLKQEELRISIDSFDPVEVATAAAAGAELVLSVHADNRDQALDWGVEVVAIPDQPGTLDGLDQTVEFLVKHGVPFRIDPIIEPIGFGFAASLGRYLEVRRRYPGASMMMGIGNLTELTDVNSAGVNTILAGFCEELRSGAS